MRVADLQPTWSVSICYTTKKISFANAPSCLRGIRIISSNDHELVSCPFYVRCAQFFPSIHFRTLPLSTCRTRLPDARSTHSRGVNEGVVFLCERSTHRGCVCSIFRICHSISLESLPESFTELSRAAPHQNARSHIVELLRHEICARRPLVCPSYQKQQLTASSAAASLAG